MTKRITVDQYLKMPETQQMIIDLKMMQLAIGVFMNLHEMKASGINTMPLIQEMSDKVAEWVKSHD